jgi:hypothetical protein
MPDSEFQFEARYVEVQTVNPEAGKLLSLATVAQAVALPPEQIQMLCERGLIHSFPGEESAEPMFDDDSIFWLRRLKSLQVQGAINAAGLDVFLELLQEVERLRQELRARAE